MPAQILFAPPAPPTFFGTAVQAARVCRRGAVVAEAAAPGPTPATAPAAPAAKPSAVALPGYQIVMSPHLRDYLGPIPSMPNPQLKSRNRKNFVAPNDVVLGDIVIPGGEGARDRPLAAYIRAGPREQVFFEEGVRAAIVTCGGICPGINTVIRELTMSLLRYGAAKVFGVQHGYRGFYGEHWRDLTAESVDGIHKLGGSVLGSSRGGFDVVKIVDAIETRDIDQVYVIGGDGTIMGCQKIFHEIKHRRLKTSVVSVPKTIDNDIAIIDLSFGAFDSFCSWCIGSSRYAYSAYASYSDSSFPYSPLWSPFLFVQALKQLSTRRSVPSTRHMLRRSHFRTVWPS